MDERNWVEKYDYLHGVYNTCQELTAIPVSKEEFERYLSRIDEHIPTEELKALIIQIRKYCKGDIVFFNRVKTILAEQNILPKRSFNDLLNQITEEEISKGKYLKDTTDFSKKIEIPKEYEGSINDFLQSEDKLLEINKILDFRIVKEETNKLLVFLLLSGAYFSNYQIILAIGDSTGGKSHLADNVMDLFPNEHTFTLTGASDKALIYKDWKDEMIINIPEAQRNPEILENLKDFGDRGIMYNVTEKNADNEFQTREIFIGKKSVIVTTTIDRINPQLENRGWKIEPNLSVEQSKEIVKKTLNEKKDMISFLKLEKKIVKIEKILKFSVLRVKEEFDFDLVEIPFAKTIESLFNYNFTKIRRDHKKLLSLIEIITSWNYRIREFYEYEGNKVLIAHPNDLIAAFQFDKIFIYNTQNLTEEKEKILKCFDELNNELSEKSKRNVLTHLKKKKEKENKKFKTDEIYDIFCKRENYKKAKRSFRNLLNSLSEDAWLEKERDGRSNAYSLRAGNTLKFLNDKKKMVIANESYISYKKRKHELSKNEEIKLTEKEIIPQCKYYNEEIYKDLIEIFEDTNRDKLHADNIIQTLKITYADNEKKKMRYTEEEITNNISYMIKLGLFKHNSNGDLEYLNKFKPGVKNING